MFHRKLLISQLAAILALLLFAACGDDDGENNAANSTTTNQTTNNQTTNNQTTNNQTTNNQTTNNQTTNNETANNLIDPDDVELQEEFVDDPPQVEELLIQRLEEPIDGENTRLAVRIADEDRERVGRAFAFLQDTGEAEPVRRVLRNDGGGADEEADDDLFSTAITVEVTALERLNTTLETAQSDQPEPPTFDVRAVSGTAPIELIDVQGFEAGDLIPIPDQLGAPILINEGASLMITDLGVVEDPQRTYDPCTGQGTEMGSWTFGQLMANMANQSSTNIDPSIFTRDFFEKWLSQQTVMGTDSNGNPVQLDQVEAKQQLQTMILEPWQQLSDIRAGTQNAPLDLAVAPFRLLAIVNRVDLRGNSAYGPSSAGEARFVFGAVEMEVGDLEVLSCDRVEFTVIFEYEVPLDSCSAVRSWGEQWVDLVANPVGSTQYNSDLENITDTFAAAGAAPSNTNGSAISQIRTNEVAFGFPWELREFRLPESSATGMFEQVTVKRNPLQNQNNVDLNGTSDINSFIQANAADVSDRKHSVPNGTFMMAPFLGGVAQYSSTTAWDGNPTLNSGTFTNLDGNELRHKFSLTTCSGCHAAETDTAFTQIDPVNPPTGPADLSGFLTGTSVSDPVNTSPTRQFDDLARRASDLSTLVNSACVPGLPPAEITHDPLLMPH